MSLFDAFRYDGKRALVVGGATGMGAAVAELVQDAGAEVVVMDRAPVTLAGAKAIQLDLSDKASIDAAVDECGGPVARVVLVRGSRRRHARDRAHQLHRAPAPHRSHARQGDAPARRRDRLDLLGRRARLAEQPADALKEFLDITDFDDAMKWTEANMKADYMWSKLAINAYVARSAINFLKRGIRINAILPGPTDTPLAQANKDQWLGFATDYRDEVGIEPSTPMEQAYPLVFLCSDGASYVNGVTVITDAGYVSSGITESFPDATPVVGFLNSEF